MDGPVRDDIDIPMPRMAPAEPGYRIPRTRDPVDATTRRLAVIGGAIALVLVAVVGIGALTGHRQSGGEVPVVRADSRPLREKPADPGGMQLDGQDDAILSGDNGGKDALIPPPEQPAPQALRDQEAADQAAADRASRAASSPPAAPAAPAATAAPATPAASAAPAAPAPAAPAPAAPAPAVPAPAVPAPARPAVRTPVEAARNAAPAALSALGGHAAVQLAALGSEQAALGEWRRLARKMPALLEGRQPVVQRAERDGKTYYRLRTGGFVDIAQATAFCQQVRAQGNGCSLASF